MFSEAIINLLLSCSDDDDDEEEDEDDDDDSDNIQMTYYWICNNLQLLKMYLFGMQ